MLRKFQSDPSDMHEPALSLILSLPFSKQSVNTMFKLTFIYSTVVVAQGRDCSNNEIGDATDQFNADNTVDAAQCETDSGAPFVEVNSLLPGFDLPVVNDNSCASSACQSIFDAVDAFEIPECDVPLAGGATAQSLFNQLLEPIRGEWARCSDSGSANAGGTTPSSGASVLSTGMAAMSVMAVMFLL